MMTKLRDIIDYDPKTGVFRWRHSYWRKKVGTIAGYYNQRYRMIQIDKVQYHAHRLAWYLSYGYWPKQIDHINGKSLDNRLVNLREASSSENNLNKPRRRPYSYRGSFRSYGGVK